MVKVSERSADTHAETNEYELLDPKVQALARNMVAIVIAVVVHYRHHPQKSIYT